MRITFVAGAIVFFGMVGCSPDEQRQWSEAFPRLSATTQTVEGAQRRIDPIARQGQELSGVVYDAAQEAHALGIPGAGLLALLASVVGTVLGVYNERRRGTVPMKEALEQVVQSVEAAFPERSDGQKAMMAAVQDRATRRMVSRIKGE